MKKLFLYLMMCFLGLSSLNAQYRSDLVVGANQFVLASADDYSPICTGYDYSYSQNIYTAEEMQGRTGYISSVAYRFEPDAQNVEYVNNLDVYIAYTAKQGFDGEEWIYVTNSDKYFSGTVKYADHKEGWLTIELDRPFQYNGGNIVVCVDNNTGEYKNNVHFFRYRAGERVRSKSVYRDTEENNLTPDNISSYNDYVKIPKDTDGSYTNTAIKFNIVSEILPLAVSHDVLDLGACPNNAWKQAAELELSARDANVNLKSFEKTNEYFQLSDVALPTQLVKGSPIVVSVKHGTGEGEVTDKLNISYDNSVLSVDLKAFAYDPIANDVYELAETVETFPFEVTPDFDSIYDNYKLPGSRTDGKDVVYKIVLEEDAIVRANVEGVNAKIALYKSDFDGKGGPTSKNSYVPENNNGPISDFFNFVLSAGEYYIVGSATESFVLKIEKEAIPAPGEARIYNPMNGANNITAPLELEWMLGEYTTEYQLLFGKTNPPTDTLVQWTTELKETYTVETLDVSTRYYWQVNARNTSGTTMGEIMSFSTPMSIPENVLATPLKSYEGDVVTVSWDEADFATGLLGYNVYVNDVKHNSEAITTTTYSISDLEYNMDGHEIYVTASYGISESDPSEKVVVIVSGKAKLEGTVYELDGTTTLANVDVALVGTDELGEERTYNLKTDAQGKFASEVYTGKYSVSAKSEELESNEYKVIVKYGKTNKVDVLMHEVFYPVRWIYAEDDEKAVNVSWGMNFSDASDEGFETGGFLTKDWKNDGEYPWVITENSCQGRFAMKSSCEGVDKGVSAIELVVNVPENGFVGFNHKVSSELKYDHGNFYIDGKLQTSIAGNTDWRYSEVYVTAGTHTYKWEYAKDSLTNMFDDAYFVDDIVFYKEVEKASEGWIGYDDGKWATSVGTGEPSATYFGVSFPSTAKYAGLTLSKIAVFDAEKGGAAQYTANIYLGGENAPEELVSTQKFNLSGKNDIVEVALSTPVALDGKKSLWITLYCDELAYPAPLSAQSEYTTTDWLSLDGKEWKHAVEEGFHGTLMLRGYLEDGKGKVRILTSNGVNTTFEGGVSTGTFVAQNATNAVNVGTPFNNKVVTSAENAERGFISKYNVYKQDLYGNTTDLIAENTTATEYVDNTWADAKAGSYRWGVSALYDGAARKVISEESFENAGLPQGWTIYSENTLEPTDKPNDDEHWGISTADLELRANDGQHYAYASPKYMRNGNARLYLVTPKIRVPLDGAINFSYVNLKSEDNQSSSRLFVYVSTESPTGPWVEAWSTRAGKNATKWTDVDVELSQYEGQDIYLAFANQYSSYGYITAIDNYALLGVSGESEILWSNTVDKDMTTELTVTVETDTEDPVAGTVISLRNTVESEYNYSVTLGSNNTYTFKDFHKGVYEVNVLKKGFVSEYENEILEIWEPTTIECFLSEELNAVANLYVSPTGWAMWDGRTIGAGDEFSFDFEDGTLNGWITLDADKDNYTWMNSIEILEPGSGHNKSVACVTSMSFVYDTPLEPDNYLVTEERYLIGENSKLKFWVCAQDASFPKEHYGVAVSLESNTNVEDFVTIWEETLSAKSGVAGIRDSRDQQGTWYEKTIDLSQYTGEKIYIALRHFDSSDEFYINVDDIALVSEARNTRALLSYQVYLDGELVAEDLKTPYYQHEDLVDGQMYTTTIVPVYTMSEGDEVSYTWRKQPCESYAGVEDFTAEYSNGVTNLKWTLPETKGTKRNATSRGGAWLTYDDGTNVEAMGISYDGESFDKFKWAVMFPASDMAKYAGKYLTKIKTYDHSAFDGVVSIHIGGTSAPTTLLHSQDFSCTGIKDYIEIPLTRSIQVTGNDNVWVVFENKNGKYVAPFCADGSNPNGRFIDVNNGAGWFDIQSMYGPDYGSWQIHAYVTDDKDEIVDYSSVEKLGVILYSNGEVLAKLAQGESFTDEKAMAGDEYTARVVYGGERDITYYAMSCPQTVTAEVSCPSPKNLVAYSANSEDGKIGTMLLYPYIPPTSDWLYYDKGRFMTGIGGNEIETFKWGIKLTKKQLEDYIGTSITKVAFFDATYPEPANHSGNIEIYFGGETSPELLVHSQSYKGEGLTERFVEVELSYPLPISGEENVWVIMSTVDGDLYPAAMSEDAGNADGRWISMDGNKWEDALGYGLNGTFMIRAFLTNERGESKSLEQSSREISFKNYKIYRGTSLDNMQEIATTDKKSYFDEVEKGSYYYQVTSVYEEDGVECESEPARAYNDNTQNYVFVEVTAIEEAGMNGLMIYPNPTNGNLNVSVEAMNRITVANALGQIVFDKEVDGDNEIIDMSQYEAGVYTVRVVTDGGVAVKRVTVVR